jgi:hypothetical protein
MIAMKKTVDPTEIEEYQAMPRVSLVLQFNLKMQKQQELQNILSTRADEIEKELLIQYPNEKVVPVIKKLRGLVEEVRCKPGKSVGIFVSPVAAKVYYFTPSRLEDYTTPVFVHPEAG